MVKLVLLLLIAGGLTIFAVQNLAPIALVVLGNQTPALPLSLWVLGALAAGGLTTLLLTGFSSISKAGAVRRASQTRSSSEAGAARSPWGETGTQRTATGSTRSAAKASPNQAAGFRSAATPRPGEDDWEREPRRDWDDWEASAPRSSEVRSPRPERLDPPPFQQSTPSPTPRIRWEDLGRSGDRVPPPDRRNEPEEQYREPQNPPKRKDEVYDAEYRVLIPPYQPPPTPSDVVPPSVPPSVPPRSAPPDPTAKPPRENPEDEDWI